MSKDKIIQQVVEKIQNRSKVGFKKYKVTLQDDHSDIFAWINHLQEELMDATLYLQKLKESASEELQEALLKKYEND